MEFLQAYILHLFSQHRAFTAQKEQQGGMQHDVPCCVLCKAWRQLEALLHLESVISVSRDSHLVQGATQHASE